MRILCREWAGRRGGSTSCGILHQGTHGFRDNTMSQHFRVGLPKNLRPAVLVCCGIGALCLGNAGFTLTRAELYQAKAPAADRSEAGQT